MRNCNGCGIPIGGHNYKYCSNRCQGEQRERRTIERWLAGGTAVKGVTLQVKKSVRKYLLQEAGYKCTKCRWGKKHPSDGKSVLHIHHIDGDASNSAKDNLVVLCPNCHSITDTYAGRNPKSARKLRRHFGA